EYQRHHNDGRPPGAYAGPRVRCDGDAAVIDVPDDAVSLMDGGKRAGNIGRHMQQEPEIGRRKFRLAALRAVKFVYVLATSNSWHEEAMRDVAVRHDDAGRPGRRPLKLRSARLSESSASTRPRGSTRRRSLPSTGTSRPRSGRSSRPLSRVRLSFCRSSVRQTSKADGCWEKSRAP